VRFAHELVADKADVYLLLRHKFLYLRFFYFYFYFLFIVFHSYNHVRANNGARGAGRAGINIGDPRGMVAFFVHLGFVDRDDFFRAYRHAQLARPAFFPVECY